MDSESPRSTQLKVVLGDEFDQELRAKLSEVLRSLGAISVGPAARYVVGSQDFEVFDVILDGEQLRIEAETYVGLSICGAASTVKRVLRAVGVETGPN